jgi:hypothetical protein
MNHLVIRRMFRAFHLVEATCLLLYFYTPMGDSTSLETLIRYVILPFLIISGFYMWKGHLLWAAKRR